ncbi:hypothetical protein FUAX_11560 [Fulvitalea axinellae]|uniref:SnoaL-like domain-containing protein n=1 Tax=Fulvitalea axinellae TaxID=1182444 RepID=A0AAU9CQN2_9BACT|nr:hypothetical protein FUAX_11560 [Fulvitalea axinellae]
MITEEERNTLLDAVKRASETWKLAFNGKCADGCVAQYETDAVMHAQPFGTFKGHNEIRKFWQKLIDHGFTDIKYSNTEIEVIDKHTAALSAEWSMNKASGVIHKELWILQNDGSAKLKEDDFEAVE